MLQGRNGTGTEVVKAKIDKYKGFVREICGNDKEALSNVLQNGFKTSFSLLKTRIRGRYKIKVWKEDVLDDYKVTGLWVGFFRFVMH